MSNKYYQPEILVNLIKWGIYACLFMPVVISNKFIFPYVFPKQIFFQIIVEILLGLYLFLLLKYPSYRPRPAMLLWAISAYLALLIISSFAGINSYHSFWSSYERMAGVIGILHYFAFLIIAVGVLKEKKDWYWFFDISVIVSVLASLYALGQYFGIESLQHGSGNRVDGPIGNPAFLAGYLLVNNLFALWLLLEKKESSWRLFYSLAIVFNFFILIQTQTRGAMLALLVTLFFLTLFYLFALPKALQQLPFKNAGRFKKYVIALMIMGVLSVVVLFLFKDSGFVQSSVILRRFSDISLADATVQTRLLAWKMTIKGFLERPVLGWGPENYYVLFNKYYDPLLYPTENWFDRAHNAYLDVLINAGLLGFLSYGAIFILAFWSLWRAYKKEKIAYHTMAIFSAVLLAYGIQNFFLFDSQVTFLMLFSVLAFIIYSISFDGSLAQPVSRFQQRGSLGVIIIILAVLLSLYALNIKPAMANKTAIEGISFIRAGMISEGVEKLQEAYEINGFGLPEIAMRPTEEVLKLADDFEVSNEERKKLTELSVEGMKKALEVEPKNARLMQMLSSLYLISWPQDESYLDLADGLLKEAIELSPNRPELYFSLAQLKVLQEKEEEVLPLMAKAVALNEKVPLSHWNYGILAIAVGEKELGEIEIQKAIELGYGAKAEEIRQLVNAYSKTEDWPKMIFWLQKWVDLEPEDAAPYARLAAVYAQIGEKEKAIRMAQSAMELDPSFREEGQMFIDSLGL